MQSLLISALRGVQRSLGVESGKKSRGVSRVECTQVLQEKEVGKMTFRAVAVSASVVSFSQSGAKHL